MFIKPVGHYDLHPDPYFVDRRCARMPLLSKEGRKCVAFVGTREKGRFRPKATAFFVEYTQDQCRFGHLVTAEHVVSGLLSKGQELWLRVNMKDGTVHVFRLDSREFRFHPESERTPTDVAVIPFSTHVVDEDTGDHADMDIRTLALNGEHTRVPTESWLEDYACPGAEVGIIGLFRSHYGLERNVPVVRMGSIAALPDEPVSTIYAGFMDAYLIEARSVAGLSGSPVFVFAPEWLFAADIAQRKRPSDRVGMALLGLVHGHFDVRNLNEDVVSERIEHATSGIHTGIAVVIPIQKIVQTVEHPELVQMRKDAAARLREGGATADLLDGDSDAPPASNGNPTHREDFKSLLGKAARTPPQDD